MVNTCFCPGCKTGLSSDRKANRLNGRKDPSVFSVPKDPELFQLWQRVIPRADRLLKPTDVVCSRHFKKEDIMFYNEPIKLFDGSLYVHMLKNPRLKKGAVPSIFSDVPGHSTYDPKEKSNDNKRKYQSAARKQFKILKAADYSGSESAETGKECFSSKEKENVLTTDLNLLPSVILNCLTSEPHAVLATLNNANTNEIQSLHSQSIAKDNFSIQSSTDSLQCLVDASLKQSKLNTDLPSKVPEKVSSNCPKSNLSSNSEPSSSPQNIESNIVGPQSILKSSEIAKDFSSHCPKSNLSSNSEPNFSSQNIKSNISVGPQSILKSSEIAKDFSTSSQEIVQVPESQSDELLVFEITHRFSNTNNSSEHLTDKFIQSNHPNESTTKSFATLQPVNPQNISTVEPEVIPQPSDSPSDLREESNNFSQPLDIATATEVIEEPPDKNFTEPQVCLVDSEIDVDLPLSAAKEKFCFNFLKANADKIDKMNSWWTVNTFDDFIICARWNSDCVVERKIVIYSNLKVKVFLKEKETILGNNVEAISIEAISNLIFKVERLRLCGNIRGKEGNCYGFLQTNCKCYKRNLCLNCIKWEKDKQLNEKLQLKELRRATKDQVELIRFHLGF